MAYTNTLFGQEWKKAGMDRESVLFCFLDCSSSVLDHVKRVNYGLEIHHQCTIGIAWKTINTYEIGNQKKPLETPLI